MCMVCEKSIGNSKQKLKSYETELSMILATVCTIILRIRRDCVIAYQPYSSISSMRGVALKICIRVYYSTYYCLVRPSPARRYIYCTAARDIFQWPHEQTSAYHQ